MAKLEAGAVAIAGGCRCFLFEQPAGDQCALLAGDAEANAVGEQSRWLWIPSAAGREKTTFDSRHRRQSPEYLAMVQVPIESR